MPVRNPRSVAAEAAFGERLKQLNAELLEPEWRGAHGKHRARCSAGHDCYPTPHGVRKGQGICLTCAGRDPATGDAAFRARLAELGATPLYEVYRGVEHGHYVRCAGGHDCYPKPHYVLSGDGICITCAGKDPLVAEAAFRTRLGELGAVPLFERWLGVNARHHVRCSAGHDCHPRPSSVRQGGGICRVCARQDPATAEAQFRARLAELGAQLLEPYTYSSTSHRVRCAAGHICYPRPALVQQGCGICLTCAGKDPRVSEAAFRARLAGLGATLLETEWLGSGKQHRVRCAQGHLCQPTPGNVSQGSGVCRFCAGSEWDAFYVVTGGGVVKFGITSGEPRKRLLVHAAQGYRDVVRLVTGLPGTVALDAENAVKSALALAGEKPVRGREYFDMSCLALILDIADSWLDVADAPSRA